MKNSYKIFQITLHFSYKMYDNKVETISSTMRVFPNTCEYISKKCRRTICANRISAGFSHGGDQYGSRTIRQRDERTGTAR